MRHAEISRNTLETRITVRLNLDGTGQCTLATGVPFLDHMLDQVARHGMIGPDDLKLFCFAEDAEQVWSKLLAHGLKPHQSIE